MRKLCLWALTAAAALAQNAPAPDLASLGQTAQQRAADWERLAQGLNASIRGLLPCDAKGPAAISEVSRASDARLAALADYLQAAAQQASRETEAAKRALISSNTLGAVLSAERAEAGQEQSGADGQVANLAAGLAEKPSLKTPIEALQEVRAGLQKRHDLIEAGMKGQESVTPALRDLVTAAEAREAAWKDVLASNEAERTRWKAYYVARLARAQTECSIIQGTAPAAAPPATKGKQP
jgi:chromosome segregation ATPase